MTHNTVLLPLVQKFFEHDLSAAAGILESMPEEEAAGALKSLPIPLAARIVKVLQISYAAVVALFEGIIAQLTILAVFLPVVAGQGGNAGAQSLAVVMRGIVMRLCR